jgi:hypothetical protein
VSDRLAEVLLASALDYASVGWHVVPLHHPLEDDRCSCRRKCASPFKHPRTRNGLDDATTDEATIRRWWRRGPYSNIGIATGATSGLVVLDVDGATGLDNWDELEQRHGSTASSFLVTTPRGGIHLYLAHPGRRVPNSAGKLAPNIDVRGDGGYVVAHPSRSADRRGWCQWTGAGCEGWADGTAVLAPMPGWVSPPVKPAPRTELLRRAGGSNYARTALDAECGQVALAPVGQRNDTLNRAAFNLGTLIGAGEIDAEVVAERLLEAARRAGLGDEEAEATLASGLSRGMANPRKRAS